MSALYELTVWLSRKERCAKKDRDTARIIRASIHDLQGLSEHGMALGFYTLRAREAAKTARVLRRVLKIMRESDK